MFTRFLLIKQAPNYGSDQYVWGREFLSTTPENPRQIEIAKHWFQWMLWGRLGYNPEIGNDRFSRMISARFPGTDGAKLLETWQNASMIYPLVTGFHWGALDFQWYIESAQSRPDPAQTPSGYHDVNRFISLSPHKGTDNVSIPDYVKAVATKTSVKGTTPIELANQIIDCTDKACQGPNKSMPKETKNYWQRWRIFARWPTWENTMRTKLSRPPNWPCSAKRWIRKTGRTLLRS